MLHFLKNSISLTRFSLLMGFLTLILFHYPFFVFIFQHLDYQSLNGMLAIVSLLILIVVANAFAYFLFFSISRKLGKFLLIISFILNALAVYFINSYGIIVDESMISNVFNTNYTESSSYFSLKMVFYVLFLGILPSIFIFKAKIKKENLKKSLISIGITLIFIILVAFINASNWLWIDKNSKQLGGLAMPWSYSVNTALFHIHKAQENKQEILLPNATIKNNEKAVVVLVIGESARSQNFSLYGYNRNTNPLLSKTENLFFFKANSCATYTTAGVKCILEHTDSGDLYEILPNYLYRNGVDVIWRTSNWGEPPVHIEKYLTDNDLKQFTSEEKWNYDEILTEGMLEQIKESKKDKILIILHTSTSHGPSYNKKYPADFQAFSPVCTSVELGNCSHQELINAYDNTIVYTDYLLSKIISDLKSLTDYKTAMLYVSDHGESLGEKNLYMHGLPMSIAPKEQYEIPFIGWISENSTKKPKKLSEATQHHIFHSVLNFLSVESPIYNDDLSVFDK